MSARAMEILRERGPLSLVRSATRHLARRLKRLLVPAVLSLGTGRVCTLCGWEGARFVSFGVRRRTDAVCPRCGAKERHRLIWEYLDRKVDIASVDDVLYTAPIPGLEAQLRTLDHMELLTTDLEMDRVDLRSDITALPFADASFDLVICSHVLEHVQEEHEALLELRRVLRDEGHALILVPQDRSREETHEDLEVTTREGREREFGEPNHVRWHGGDVPDRLTAAGFQVSVENYVDTLDQERVQRQGLKEDGAWIHDHSLIFHCRTGKGAKAQDR